MAPQCIYGWSDEVGEDGDRKKGSEIHGGWERVKIAWPIDDLVLCDKSEEELREMVGRFAEMCRRRGLKVNAGKGKVMGLDGEEGLECEVHIDWIHLEHVSEFKYLCCVLDESVTDGAECSRKVANGRKVAGVIRLLVDVKDLQLEWARVLPETLLEPVLMYGSKTMLRKEKEKFKIRAVQMDSLRGLLGIIRHRVQNTRIRDLCGVKKGLDERIDEGLLRCFSQVERMENDRIAKKVYVGECAGSG